MFRTHEEMAVRDATCREVSDAFGRAGVMSRHNRMPAMPCSSVVAWSPYGPSRQRRAVVTVEDGGACHVFMTAVHDVAEGCSGDDSLGGLAIGPLCALPAGTPRLGDEILRRLRAADDEADTRRSWSDPDEARPAIRSAVVAAAAWALGDPFARDGFADDGNPLSEDDDPPTTAAVAPASIPSRRGEVDRWNAWAAAVGLGLVTAAVFVRLALDHVKF